MSRMCPSSSLWNWEALPHGNDAFLIGFPSFEDLRRVDGFQMGVPSFKDQATVSIWQAQDIPHKAELEQVWVHVQGVPYTVRHFLGLWALGSLIGTTLNVDLLTLRSRGIVRIKIGMLNSKSLDKFVDNAGSCIGATCVIKLKSYDFFFRREPADFVPDPAFVPFFWRRKSDDADDEEMGKEKGVDSSLGLSGLTGSQSSNMEVDANLASSTLFNNGKFNGCL